MASVRYLTDLGGTAVELDAFHRRHAVVELCLDDWKEGAGMEHCTSGDFSANAAWMSCAASAYNLICWSALLGDLVEDDTLVVAAPLRTRYFSVPARLVNRSGRPTLRGPTHWPCATSFTRALATFRGVISVPIGDRPRTGVAAEEHLRVDNRNHLHELRASHVLGSAPTNVRTFNT